MEFHFWPAIGWSLLAVAQASRAVFAADTKEDVLTVESTVNARFVPESNRAIPFTVNPLDALALEHRQIKDCQSLLWQTPGVAVNTDGQNPESSIKIRGVGSINQVSNDDTSVVTMLNGVSVPQGNLTNRLLDIEQVDILKGPQGTLFGRNSEAGVINIISNKPTDIFAGHVGGEGGTHGHALAQMVVNTPLTDTLNGRVALQDARQDSALNNQQDGDKPLSRPQNLSGRASLGWQPDEQDSLFFTADRQRQRHNASAMTLLAGGDKISVPKGSINDGGNDTTLTLNWQHRWDTLLLSHISGWGDYYHVSSGPAIDARISQRLFGIDYDSWRMFSNKQTQFSQELRLGSTEDSPLFWVSGINYLHSGRTHRFNGGWSEIPDWDYDPMNAQIHRRFTHHSVALFGETTFPLTERLDVTTGLRHSWEKTDYRARWRANPGYANPGATAQADNQSLSEGFFTGRIGLNYLLSDAWNVYSTWSRGHKPGGFSNWDTSIASGEPSTPYKAARVDSVELGAKALISQLKLEVNPALFYSRTRNDHYFALIDPSRSFATVTENFDTESKGAELSASWKPDADVMVSLGLDYTRATITKLPANSQSGGREGNRIPDVPLWGASLATDYSRPMQLAGLPVVLDASLNYRYSSQREADVGNHFRLGETHLLNARLGFKSRWGDAWLWSTNLLNHRSPVYGFYFPALAPQYGGTGRSAHVGALREGRVAGISYQYHF
ncbi:TonB-dependent receptor [Kosakonia sp. H02]|nr:TonB-dependent receptor [Kosakonia sp. H02]